LDRGNGRRVCRAPAIARMGLPPGLYPGDGLRTSVVVLVLRLGQPFGLAGPLARRFARRRCAIALMPYVAWVRRKTPTAMQAVPLMLSTHLPSSPVS
jgi:hypothetical protein